MSRSLGLGGEDRVVVVGGGIAGLATALSLAPAPVTVVTTAALGTEAATCWAQGGIAAALGPYDTPDLHADDTVAAGAGLTEMSIARRVANDAAACIDTLIGWGVRFDRDPDGDLAFGLEAAHSRRRIIHAGGDASGATILTALARTARGVPSIEIMEGVAIIDLVLDDDEAVVGVLGTSGGRQLRLPARAVVLATGGLGGLYGSTTNPLGAVGSGLSLCARAGAVLRDLEFVQFHPTAMALGQDPMPLATEAIRGEGAVLIDGRGERFMAEAAGGELASRDVVARAIWAQIKAGQSVFLDAREAIGARLSERFPTVTARCRAAGLDPATEPIPDVIRDGAALQNALVRLNGLAPRDEAISPSASLALVGLLIAAAALLRTESRGAHFRRDYPRAAPGWQRHTDLTLDDARALAASLRTQQAELVDA